MARVGELRSNVCLALGCPRDRSSCLSGPQGSKRWTRFNQRASDSGPLGSQDARLELSVSVGMRWVWVNTCGTEQLCEWHLPPCHLPHRFYHVSCFIWGTVCTPSNSCDFSICFVVYYLFPSVALNCRGNRDPCPLSVWWP